MMIWLLLAACAQNNPTPESTPAPPPAEEEEAVDDADEPGLMAQSGAETNKTAERYASRHILIAHKDSARSNASRTRAEAKVLAETLLAELRAGADMPTMARERSDDHGSARKGGFVGSVALGSFVESYEAATLKLAEGELSELVESPYGFHIIRRESLQEIRLRQILVQFEGNLHMDSKEPEPSRTRPEALARIQEAEAALAGGADFQEVCASFSDGATSKRQCDLGWFMAGELGTAFDDEAFELAAGERSEIVETNFGFHVVERTE